MQDPDTPRTGFIYSDDKNVSFYLDDYTITLIKSEYNLPRKITKINPTGDGFLRGKTHSWNDIAVYIGSNTLHLMGSQTIKFEGYIASMLNLGKEDMEYFWGIEFVGGTLPTLTKGNFSSGSFTEDGGYQITPKTNSKEYTVHIDNEECKIILGNYTNVENNFEGVHFRNNSVFLKLIFQREKPRIKAFEYLEKIKKLLSFMTFRENVGFETIYLLGSSNESPNLDHFAQLFCKTDNDSTKKPWIYNILFDDLGDQLPVLVELFMNSHGKTPAYMLGFIPEDGKHLSRISGSTIREVCSALECELTYIKDLHSTEEDLEELKKEVKNVVKQYKGTLSDKTYNLIHSNIKHWSIPLGEKLCALYHRYEDEMLVLNPSSMHISDEEINKFVQYRNNITHGSQDRLDQTLATTTFVLQGLVYCCLLTRIGMKREQILELCKNQQILK